MIVALKQKKIQNINQEITLLAIGTGCGKCCILRIYCGILEYIFIIFIVSTEVFQNHFKPVAIHSHRIPDSKYGGIYRRLIVIIFLFWKCYISLEAFFRGSFNGANLEIGSWMKIGVFTSLKN